jgi:hypothetical protein
LEVRKTSHIPLKKLILIASEIDRREFTNRVGLGHVWTVHVWAGVIGVAGLVD